MIAKMSPGKIAILSHVFPPSSSGQAIVLYRLLRECDPHRYCLMSNKHYPLQEKDTGFTPDPDCVTSRLAGEYHYLTKEMQVRVLQSRPFQLARATVKKLARIPRLLSAKPRLAETATPVSKSPQKNLATKTLPKPTWKGRVRNYLNWVDDWFNLKSQVNQRTRSILGVLQQEKCRALVACSGDLINIPAGFFAARQAGIPFYPYLFDDYPRQWVLPFQHKFANRLWPNIVRESTSIIVPNEFLARTYRDNFQIDPVIIPNPVEEVPPLLSPAAVATDRPIKIVYTGAIYEAHFDAFHNLLQALQGLPSGTAELHIYTSGDKAFLESHGVGKPAIVHPPLPVSETQKVQRDADVLFLPLAFASPFPEIIRTSAPGKMGELLANGRPILVHAPQDCFVSWYCREHQCAAVVDEACPNRLRETLLRLQNEPNWVSDLVQRARSRARQDFHVIGVRDSFFQIFSASE